MYRTHIKANQPWWKINWREIVEYRDLLWSNPLSFIVECARWMFTGTGTVSPLAATVSIGITLILLISGLLIFNRIQRNFVDTI